MAGYIKLFRDIEKHWIYEEKRKFSRYEAWLDLLMMVNHSDGKTMLDGELVEVKRGERITSIRKLMDRWDWSNTKVVKFLELLKKDEMILFEITPKKKTLIKIVKYDKWQGFDGKEETEETTQKRQEKDTEKTVSNINKNDKEEVRMKKKKPSSPKQVYDEQNEYYIIADFFVKEIRKNFEEFKTPNMQKWSDDIRLLVERDKKDKKRVCQIIRLVQEDDFWFSNCLSPSKLRTKFSELEIKFLAKGPESKTRKAKSDVDWENA